MTIEYTLITDKVTKNTPNVYEPVMIMRHCYYVHNYWLTILSFRVKVVLT